MKRRNFLKASAGSLVAGATLSTPAIAQTSPQVSWRLQSAYPRALTTVFGGAETLSQYVSDLTDGNFQIQVFASGEIVPGLQVIDAVTNNTVEMGHTISGHKKGADPTWALGTGLPFGMNARQQNSWFYHGGGNELLDPFYERNGLVAFPAGNSGTQMGGWWRREVNTVADLQGVKFRTSGLGGEILNRIGAVTQTLSGSDIYPALERGTIDAAEFIGPYDDEKLGFVEVAPYYYYPGWWESGLCFHAFINLEQWNALPASYQSALKVASQAVNADVLATYDAQNPAALRRLIEQGAQLRPFSREILDACYEEALALYSELSAENEGFKTIFDSMWSYRREQYLWWQVAEYSGDTMNIASVRN